MIWIFCFVFCHHSGISSWSSSPRGVWSADVSDIPAAANICHHNSWPLFWLVFKKLTQNYFWETIRGRTSWLPHSQTPENWESAALPWSSSLWVWASGFEWRIEVPWWHLIPRTQSLQHRLEQSQVVLLYFVKNNPVRLSCFLPLSFIPSHFIFKYLHIRVVWRCTQPWTEWLPRWCWWCLVILADVWHGACFAFQSVINF